MLYAYFFWETWIDELLADLCEDYWRREYERVVGK
jgi:hypothetical protein